MCYLASATLLLRLLRANPSSRYFPVSGSLSLGPLRPDQQGPGSGISKDSNPTPSASCRPHSEPLSPELPERDYEHPRMVFSYSTQEVIYMSQTQKAQRIHSRKVTPGWSEFRQRVWRIFLSAHLFLICVLQQTGSWLTRDCVLIPIIKNIWQASGNAFPCQGNGMCSPTRLLHCELWKNDGVAINTTIKDFDPYLPLPSCVILSE